MSVNLDPDCKQCQSGPEVFHLLALTFDVTKAIEIVTASERPVIPVNYDPEAMLIGINAKHLDHVDPTIPGIIATVKMKKSGEELRIVIDGNHRAARCRRDGGQFTCYKLTEAESYEVCKYGKELLRVPNEVSRKRAAGSAAKLAKMPERKSKGYRSPCSWRAK
jgi:hypothetical protein